MKYCFNCGAPLAGSAASFCSECGKAIPKRKERPPETNQTLPKGKRPPPPPSGKPKGPGKPPAGYRPPPPGDPRRPKRPPPPGIAGKGQPPFPQTQTRIIPEPEDTKHILSPTGHIEPDIPDEFTVDEGVPADELDFASESGEQCDQQDELVEASPDEDIPDPQDEGYDGYYNDVLPEDDGYVRERLEPELIKRIALVIGSVLVIVILSVLVMQWL